MDKPLTIDEAANFLKISKGYLYRLTSGGKIPFHKPTGKRIFFKKEELESFIWRNRVYADYEITDQANTLLNNDKQEG
jgi:excisionase family DNA binding protein